AHAVPAGDALLTGHVGQGLLGAGLQLLASHAKQLRRRPAIRPLRAQAREGWASTLKRSPREPSLVSQTPGAPFLGEFQAHESRTYRLVGISPGNLSRSPRQHGPPQSPNSPERALSPG